MQIMNIVNRRDFLAHSSALAGASLLPFSTLAQAEPPPEIKKIRMIRPAVTCVAPMLLAEDLLRSEGFSQVEYVTAETETGPTIVASGRADLTMWDVGALLPLIDEGKPIAALAGIHAGCQELFANDRVESIRDLKGKRFAVTTLGNGDHIFVSSILAYVGIDPKKDISWVTGTKLTDPKGLFIKGEVDAFMSFAPEAYEVKKKKIGHVILNTVSDRPWSQYFCCMISANRDFIGKYPIATKRAMRAILKSADICAQEPARVAKFLVDKGYETPYEIGLDVLKALPYRRWREANPEDTLRFHANRLHEVKMLKTSPNKLIAQGTDWRFLNELKKELKA
jgi:NitT/TauT family transport system substrate-binding protein